MGLDQFAYKTKVKFTKEVDFNSEINEDRSELVEIHYWRKHANLQGWMESLYKEKGGSSKEFNCVPLQLTKEDLDRLAADLIDQNLPETQGFFFGQSENSEEEMQEDLEFVKQAHRAIDEGYTVYYDSWW
jgi:hypothetical protein